MDSPESGGNDAGREGSKKLAAVNTDEEPLSKVARREASSNVRRSEHISVPRRQASADKEVEVEHLVRALDVRNGGILSLIWENPDAMVYVRQTSKSMDARSFVVLPSHGVKFNTFHAGRFRTVV